MSKRVGWRVIFAWAILIGMLGTQAHAQNSRSSKTKFTPAQKAAMISEFRAANDRLSAGVFKPRWDTKYLPGYPAGSASYCGRYRVILGDLQKINQAEGLDPIDFEIQQQWNLHLAWFYENCNTEVADKMKPTLTGTRVPPGCPDISLAIYPGRLEEAYYLYENIGRAFPDKVSGGTEKDVQRVAHRIAQYHEAQYIEKGDPGDLCQAREWRVWHKIRQDVVDKLERDARNARQQVVQQEKFKNSQEERLKAARQKVADAQKQLQQAQQELAEEERKFRTTVAQQRN